MKIAVCLSGQSRTWKPGAQAARSFFSGDHEYTFFGHTWDENSWKVLYDGKREYIYEKLNPTILRKELNEAWKLETLRIDPQVSYLYNDVWRTWKPMLKSGMIATHLKSLYEADMNMKFDIVVRARWDVAYRPGTNFESLIPKRFRPTALYTQITDFEREFRLPAIDDVLYFGSSRVIDIVEGFYWYYVGEQFNVLTNHDLYNITYDKVGAGVLLHKWCTLKNISICTDNISVPIVIRRGKNEVSWPEDYETIVERFLNFAAV